MTGVLTVLSTSAGISLGVLKRRGIYGGNGLPREEGSPQLSCKITDAGPASTVNSNKGPRRCTYRGIAGEAKILTSPPVTDVDLEHLRAGARYVSEINSGTVFLCINLCLNTKMHYAQDRESTRILANTSWA